MRFTGGGSPKLPAWPSERRFWLAWRKRQFTCCRRCGEPAMRLLMKDGYCLKCQENPNA